MPEPVIRTPVSLGDYYARLVTARAGVADGPILEAFAVVPRERFLGRGPWPVATGAGYTMTPSDDPAFIYADVVVALLPDRALNNGEPSFHARCLAAAAIQAGETVVHVGAGVGYYSAVMAQLAGPAGRVEALEIDAGLAARAAANLAPWPQARVSARSGLVAPFPEADVIYVNAGVSAPAEAWLDALAPAGRLLLPLTAGWMGLVLLLTARGRGQFDARVVSPTGIIPCVGGQDPDAAQRLAEALGFSHAEARFTPRTPRMPALRSLRRGIPPDETCWLAGATWWLSTAPLKDAESGAN